MNKIITQIVHRRKLIIIIFSVLSILCLISSNFVTVNYKISDYIPDDAASTKALKVMNKEYSGDVPNTRIMVSDVSIQKALSLKHKLEKINGVTKVQWLDDSADLTQPLETINSKTLNTYYKNKKALYYVTVSDSKEISALQKARELLEKETGKSVAMAGSAVATATATTSTATEIPQLFIFVVPICFLILFISTTSYIEPFLFMLSILVAILLNRGTNIFFGEISFVTNAAGSILQLAVSMDYAIFLLHRFSAYRKEEADVEQAMVKAIKNSFTSITASGLTTLIGFAALIVMRFKIGPDMGLVMAKAIVLSMLSVLIFLPAVALSCYKLIDKTSHKSFLPSFSNFAQGIFRIKYLAITLVLILIIPSAISQTKNSFYYGASHIFGPGTSSYREGQLIEKNFGKSNQMVLMVPRGDFGKEILVSKDLHQIAEVSDIISYVDTVNSSIPTAYLDQTTTKQLLSKNFSRMIITVKTDAEGERTFDLVKQIRKIGNKYYGDSYYLAGDSISTYDMKNITTADTGLVNIISVGAIFLVIMLTMRSIIVPIILVLIIETAIWINLSIPYFQGTTLFYIAYLIISSIQLGATVDYAILLSTRYRETRRSRLPKEAIIHSIKYSTVSILTSASILTLSGYILGVVSSHGIIKEIGILLCRGTILSTIMVIFVLPAFLFLLDKHVITKDAIKGELKNE